MSNALTSRLKKKKKGFTLIELIIVMAIIVILAAIAIPSFSKIRESSKVKADTASADTIKKTVITLVTDGSIKEGATFNINPAATGAAKLVGYDSADGSISASDLADYFKNVGTLQEKGATSYSVSVATDESVTVTPSN